MLWWLQLQHQASARYDRRATRCVNYTCNPSGDPFATQRVTKLTPLSHLERNTLPGTQTCSSPSPSTAKPQRKHCTNVQNTWTINNQLGHAQCQKNTLTVACAHSWLGGFESSIQYSSWWYSSTTSGTKVQASQKKPHEQQHYHSRWCRCFCMCARHPHRRCRAHASTLCCRPTES